MPTHTYAVEIYPPGDRETADSNAVSERPFMPFLTGDLVQLPEAQRTVVVEQTLRLIIPDASGDIVDKVCVYTREADTKAAWVLEVYPQGQALETPDVYRFEDFEAALERLSNLKRKTHTIRVRGPSGAPDEQLRAIIDEGGMPDWP